MLSPFCRHRTGPFLEIVYQARLVKDSLGGTLVTEWGEEAGSEAKGEGKLLLPSS